MDLDRDITELRDITAEIIIKNCAPVFVGTHSYILKGFWHGKPIAIKVLRVISREQRVMRRKITRERDIWSHLKHPHIVPLYGYTEESEVFGLLGALVSPWHQNGDAAAYLESRGTSLTMVQRIELWRGVVAGVTYLHSHNPSIIHGDLKPGNILIDEDGTARLCDFGLARIFLEEGGSGTTTTSDHTGTDRYLAYELVVSRDPSVVSKASDIYALGCIGLYFVFLQSPYENRRNNLLGEIFQDIRDGIPPASQPSNVSSESLPFWSLLEACWNLRSPERPEAAVILDWLDLRYNHLPSCKEAIKKEKPIMPLQVNGVINSREGESLPQASGQEGKEKGALSFLLSKKAKPRQVPSLALEPIPPDKPMKEIGSVQQERFRTYLWKQDDKLKLSAGPDINPFDQSLISQNLLSISITNQRSLRLDPSHLNPTKNREDRRTLDNEISSFTPISPTSLRSPYTLISPFFSLATETTRNSRSASYCPSPMREESMRPGEALDLTGQISVPASLPLFEGTYSSIYKGEYGGHEVAVKSIRTVKDAQSMRIKIREAVEEWWYIRHPNVLSCLGYAEDPGFGDFGAIISPWCDNGNSLSYLAQGRPPAEKIKIFLEVARGLQYLHQTGPSIIHGDLKPMNILIDNEKTAKIVDYDFITRITQDEFVIGKTITSAYTNTVRYLAYELIEYGQPPTKASDVYALGCIGHEFIYSQPPYAHIRNGHVNAHYKICKEIGRGVPPATRSSNISGAISGLWELLEACWDNKPERRPEAGDVVRYLEQHGQAISDALEL